MSLSAFDKESSSATTSIREIKPHNSRMSQFSHLNQVRRNLVVSQIEQTELA